jgi:hypothetical protein
VAALAFAPLGIASRTDGGDSESFAAARAMFRQVLTEAPDAGSAARLGLKVKPSDGEWEGVLLSEEEGDCAGRGAYLIRQRASLPLAITAPHRGSDLHTGTIAAALFAETGAAAAAWNSAPRMASEACDAAIDLARQDKHHFTAFSLAFAEAFPAGRVVQLHGFDGDKRNSEAARNAEIIVSDGTGEPGDKLLDLADCLSRRFAPRTVLVYPIDTGELGALSNAQAQVLRKEARFEGFVHLEMSALLRAELVQDEDLRTRLGRCLVEAAR